MSENDKRNKVSVKDRTGVGNVFGALTVTDMIPKGNRMLWKCKCNCGKSIIAKTTELNRGKIKDCGCGCGEAHRYKDISGKRKGHLIALYPTDKRDKKGSVVWVCKCDCGNLIQMTQSDFVYGDYVSCGCVRKERLDEFGQQYLTFVDNTCIEWLRSRKSRSDNTSGHRGVYKASTGKYKVYIGLQGKKYYLGTYDSYNEAVDLRERAEECLHDGFINSWESWMDKAHEDEKWASENPFYFDVDKRDRSLHISTNLKDDEVFMF